MNAAARKIAIPEHVLFRQLGDEAVLLNLKTGHYFGFDTIGLSMWRALVDSPDLAAATRLVLAQYDAGAERVERDLNLWLAKLRARGLLELVPGED